MSQLTVRPVTDRWDLRAFVRFPWRVYRGDPNWVPPLIAEQLRTLDPARNPFFQRADVALLLARRGREVVGTMAVFLDHKAVEGLDEPVGGFGFFEVIEEYPVAARLLDAAAAWLRERDARWMRGPMNFNSADHPGVLIGGADCPPAMLESHTPPYYADFLERYGMEKHQDLYAYRASRHQIGENMENLPPELVRVAEAAERLSDATVRQVRLEEWDREVALIHRLFNATMTHLPYRVPMSEEAFRRIAARLRPFIDPNLVVIAEVAGEPVGLCLALPDINRVLIHLNGRLFPFNWLRLRRLTRRVDVATFKMLGVLPSYRMRGIDALLYMEVLRGFIAGGYAWLDGSVTSEYNLMVNLVAQRLGAERYKHFRMYQLTL
ncbi:MAG TPA: N-acetyltransferase [Anaerolineales bacterium]|nr:N-acetyltransferase [Anaerolineae bacterium]HIQ02690.1 N-acetyltransferase [Anaerolineales bacterium]